MASITLDGIGHAYPSRDPGEAKRYALKPMHHVWQHGRAYALLGPSGCGKTTLLNIISGLVTPSDGRLLFDQTDVTHVSTEKRNIAQVFQFPVIYDTMTVRQNLLFPLRNRGVDKRVADARVMEIAGLLDLVPVLDRRARGLTADAKQKISLGRGLVRSDVSAVLFDEPLTVIDPALKWELRSKLKAVHEALDMLMIYVTHDQVEAMTFADEVVVMNDGRVLQIGTPTELFERPAHAFVGYFIGSPGMNFLPASIEGSAARVADAVFPLASRYVPPAGRVQLGFRPDYATVAPDGEGIPVTLRRIEDLGRRRLARVALGEHELVATLPAGTDLNGEIVRLRVAPEHLHVYVDDERITGEAA
ncbi:ABC transporter ATP-binding protein [Lichenicola sp.]|uniref:ABC transporter ATP-binding protein n=1 Tax=Lichenicola sp. TaxID=2804529 RepID=UPI003B00FE6A